MTDNAKLVQMIYRFIAYVKSRDGEGVPLSFQDKKCILGEEEYYKTEVFEDANMALQYKKWTAAQIEDGTILFCAQNAMSLARNLVYRNQKYTFQNRINPEHAEYREDAARVLYRIYKSDPEEEAAAFAEAVEVFGGSYDTISYLFFIKDMERFFPVSPGNLEKGLASVGVNYRLSYQCSWENYCGFIKEVNNIRKVMQDILPDVHIRPIDAHSFLWIISRDGEETDFLRWKSDAEAKKRIEEETEEYISSKAIENPRRYNTLVSYFARSSKVVQQTKDRANGICQLCRQPAPFVDKNGNPYLEVHHIKWLSDNGPDTTDNTVALCPNCHTKMHIVNDKNDVEKLENCNKSNIE